MSPDAKPRGVPMSIDAILDAAERVASTQGVSGLTFDAVAAQAKVSKGGVLHHFPSKDALVRAMIERIVTHWRALFLAAIERTPAGRGRTARALCSLVAEGGQGARSSHRNIEPQPQVQAWTESCQRMSTTLMAAMVSSPEHLEPLRASYRDIFERIASDGLNPGCGEAVMAALDGLWLWLMLGVAAGPAGGSRRTDPTIRVLAVLDDLLKVEGGGAGVRKRGQTPARKLASKARPAGTRGYLKRAERSSSKPRVAGKAQTRVSGLRHGQG